MQTPSVVSNVHESVDERRRLSRTSNRYSGGGMTTLCLQVSSFDSERLSVSGSDPEERVSTGWFPLKGSKVTYPTGVGVRMEYSENQKPTEELGVVKEEEKVQ